MMSQGKLFARALWLCWLAVALGAGTASAQSSKPALEPKAVEILKTASSRLAAAHTMSFTAVITDESPSRLAIPLAYTTKSEVVMQRPDKLRVITVGDGPASEFYYNGKVMMAYSPAEDLVAIADAPPTIDETMEVAYHNAAIYFPFDDVIVSDPYKDISDDLRMAFYIGQSNVVGGVATDMIAYDTGGVFVEVWIGVDDKLPRQLRAIYADDPLKLRHRLELSNWQIDPNVSADFFTSQKATAAKHIKFARPDAPLPPRAGTKGKASTTPKPAATPKPASTPNNSQ